MNEKTFRKGCKRKTAFGRRMVPLALVLAIWMAVALGCSPKIRLFPDAQDPLEEYTLEGEGREKVLLIPVRGVLSDVPEKGWVRTRQSVVEQVVSQLRKAEKDDRIRAVVLKIDSPGGTVTAGDILYHEIERFKRRTGAKVVVAMMNVAASGAYYISLSADHIMAHPTTLTGSVGVIFVQPEIMGFMGKIGVDVGVYKTGENKDMGSFFRKPTDEERTIIQDVIDRMGGRFFSLVKKHRNISDGGFQKVATGRIFLAEEALDIGMIDGIGYLDDAVLQARSLAGISKDAPLVVYRRTEYPDDTIYLTTDAEAGGTRPMSLVNTGLPDLSDLGRLDSGFYYLWVPGASQE